MLIRIRDTGQIVTDSEFRALHPNTSMPAPLTVEALDSWGADPVLEGPQPVLGRYQVAAMDGVVPIGESWFTHWVAVDMPPEACATLDAQQAAMIRDERNRRLTASDWTQLSDAPVDAAAWATYRQALRDLTQQAGFPWEVVWPVPPI